MGTGDMMAWEWWDRGMQWHGDRGCDGMGLTGHGKMVARGRGDMGTQ